MVGNRELVPAEVEQACALAYPGLAARGMDFVDAVQDKSAGELLGLVNGVKGKLFELDLVSRPNEGALPAGLTASQLGYDLLVTHVGGTVMALL